MTNDLIKENLQAEYLLQLEHTFGANNYSPLNVVLSRGEGVWVWDTEGKKYLDCLSAYSAVNQGHCHPVIIDALINQARKLTLTSRAFRNDQLGLFYQELSELSGYQRVLPMNSGAEAVETAIKAVRKYAYEKKNIPEGHAEIITGTDNFHGRTTTIVGFSSHEGSRSGFGPFTPGFVTVPYGDITAVRNSITANTAAVLLEPIQGEAGIIMPPEGFLKELRDICTENDVLLILDEIQSGLGRTGKLMAQDHEKVRADATVIGKALSGGVYPVSALLADSDLMDVFTPGDHGSTYGGNPLACAVARAALRVLVEEGMIENSEQQGAYMLKELRNLNSKNVKEVRGRGLMIGVELHEEAGAARPYCEKLAELGILCKDTHKQTIRIAPPLVLTRDQVDWLLERFSQVLG